MVVSLISLPSEQEMIQLSKSCEPNRKVKFLRESE